MRSAVVVAALLAVVPMAARAQDTDERWLDQCRHDHDSDQARACDVTVQRIPARAQLIVRPGNNGGVLVNAADRSDVEIHMRVQASARSQSRAGQLLKSITPDLGQTIRAKGPDAENHENWSVVFVVYVPRNTSLDLATDNGPLGVKEVVGKMVLRTSNGPLMLNGIGGDVRARTDNGPLNVRLSGERWNGAGLDAETSNGPLMLEIPQNYNAELQTGTVNGPFNSEIPLTVKFRGGEWKRIETTLGKGGVTVRAVTTNGPVTLQRARR